MNEEIEKSFVEVFILLFLVIFQYHSFAAHRALLWADILVAYAFFMMQNYLTKVWKLSFTHAAGILNIWGGICMVLPVFFLFLVDEFLGHFMMLVISSIAYSVGIGFITMSTPPVLGTCKRYEPQCIGHTQKFLFYTGMVLVAVGISGHIISVKPLLKEQKEKDHQDGAEVFVHILLALLSVIGAIALPYIKPWALRFGIPAICTVFVTLLFLSGWCTYDKENPKGSPITNVFRVFVASAFNRSKPWPLDSRQLHKIEDKDTLTRTRFLRCLEKAAIKEDDREYTRWRLCSIGEVEEAKAVVRMVPMWMTFIVVGIVSSTGNTYFIEQANHMNRNLGKWRVPLPILKMFFEWAKTLFVCLATKRNRCTPSIGIAVAMIFSVLCCVTAATIENRRVHMIIKHGLLDKPDKEIPMSMFWLLFQFFLLGGLDSFFEHSVAAFHANQALGSMEDYLSYFSKGVSGLGFMFSVVSVYVVGEVSERGGKMNWFQFTLNRSRLDRDAKRKAGNWLKLGDLVYLQNKMVKNLRIYFLLVVVRVALLWADILVAYALFVMQNYLTDVWKLSFTHAAGILNIWGGICTILPAFFLFLVDQFLGNFTMLVISSIAYSVGIVFVTISIPTFLGTCKEYQPECIGYTQKVLFYIGMALIAVGTSGHFISVKPFLDEQEDRPDEGAQVVARLFAFIIVVLVPVTGAIALPYIKPWAIRFGIPAICTVFVMLLFFTGWCNYRKVDPRGSPITNVCRVFVAFAFKQSKPFPDDDNDLHRTHGESFTHTRFLRRLEKAAIKDKDQARNSRWRLCSIGDVEEAKIAVRMVPMWMTFVVVGIVSSIGNTYFIEQANHMNRNIGKWRVPLPTFKMLFDYAKNVFELFAEDFLKKPNTPRRPSIGIAVAMIFSVLCCITAAKIENKRINVIIKHDLLNKPDEDIPMSMFWLLFQFFLLSGLDALFQKSVAAFYADQAPDSMEGYLSHFSKGVSGLGFMFSVLSVHVVGKISERGGRSNWFQYTLNRSRLDRYYWVLAVLSSVNLIIFILVASCYRYKNRVVLDRELVNAEPFVVDQADNEEALLWADILVAYALFVMQNYLTDVWKLSFTHAAGILNIWGGICIILPAFFLFLVDQFLGNFTMLVISSIAYSVGIVFVTISLPTFLGTCKEYEPQCIGYTQKVLFYIGMALIAVGMSGHLVSVEPFLKEQKDKPDKGSIVLILFMFILVVLVPVTGAIALPYIKPWAIRFGIPAICTVFVTFLFFTGWCTYDKEDELKGSPIINICRVFVAFAFKQSKPVPPDSRQLHRNNDQESLTRTRFLRCLEKAAIKDEDPARNSRWRLCSIGEVEEAKIAVRMVPMWMTFVVVGIVSSIGNTYFIEQANHMNRNIGKWRVPLPIFKMLFDYAKNVFEAFAEAFLKKPNTPRRPSIGIAVAMIFSVLCCITAAKIEKRRINVIIDHGLLDKPDEDIPMSMFWLLFQFFLLSGLDAFFQKSVAAFYADQAPNSMEEYLSHFSKGVSGLGFMFSVLSVHVVGKISERGGRSNWFQYTLNRSRLDRYYWVLAVLSSVNLIIFILVASCYRYKNRVVLDRELVNAEPFVVDQADNEEVSILFAESRALLWADILVAYALFVMQNYLTDVWKLSLTHAAGILNVWSGMCVILPGFFLFLVDALLGNFTMLVMSSIAYSVGIGFVTMSIPTVLGTCKEYEPECIGYTHKVLFYIGMALIAVGMSGHVISVKPFLEEQEDKPDEGAKVVATLFLFILVVLVPVTGAIALPYIKPWAIRFGIPAICTVFVTLLFFTNWSNYHKKKPKGSPISNVCRVFVAFAFKQSKPFPLDDRDLHRNPGESFTQTRFLRCLEKAAIKDKDQVEESNWRLCTVGEVEEAKIAVRMVPMWMTFIVVGIVSSIGNTYFIEQANNMNRNIGKWRVPLPIIKMIFDYAKEMFASIAGNFLKDTKGTRRPSIGIAVAMIFSVLCCITAARIEKRRLNVIINHGLLDKPDEDIPMSMFWLLFQFILLGGLDAFFQKGVAAFYADQAPNTMKDYLSHFSKGISGLGFMFSVVSVYVVGKVSERGGRSNWFQYTLNKSRLDRYYWVLAALSSANLIIFILVAWRYRYKNLKAEDRERVDGEPLVLASEENHEAAP
ncbi:hypothetical protein BUALT_Bualt09G0123300 [Buddleja alternifolia]|uniref:Proton-dependent oligopeptide transporter family n=1 Tax=Buddleja alternifolia TaxID=168488 RepID=A0AAV6X1E2_9LAMI|nr:hypothetical protein BUALT_Bualt09G0123300 [Buddleja alternifolia]